MQSRDRDENSIEYRLTLRSDLVFLYGSNFVKSRFKIGTFLPPGSAHSNV